MPEQKPQTQTTLLRAYLLSMLGVAALFCILAAGIWVYTDEVVESEKTLITQLLPDLDMAFQLAASAARLQSLGALLSSAATDEQLMSRQSTLSKAIEQARATIVLLGADKHEPVFELAGEIDKISANIGDLVMSRVRQLRLERMMDLEQQSALEQVQAFEKLLQSRVISLTEKLFDANLDMAETDNAAERAPDAASAAPSPLAINEMTNLAIQDYLLLEQSAVSLQALIDKVRLLSSLESISVAEHERDFLISSLVSRSIYMEDGNNTDQLLRALRDIRTQLLADDGLFVMKTSYQRQTEAQRLLDNKVQGEISTLLAKTSLVRDNLRGAVNELATVTLSGLDNYRFFLVALTVITLMVLALISYWLLYLKTVVPLVRITAQLDNVGTGKFSTAPRPYLLTELTRLGEAVRELDTVQKDLLAKDREMQRINEDLEKANQDLEQFAHVASHDLQEPLRKLKQFSELLEEDYQPILDEEGRYYLSAIRGAAKRMSALIKETLAYSRAGSANQSLEEVDLADLLVQLRDDMDLSIKEADAMFEVEPLPVVYANALGMAQLFRNLLTNALKYRKQDVPAHISITVEPGNAAGIACALIHVRDEGVGIKPKFLERIFNPFERAHAGEVHGTGLGLAICKKVCESHGWSLHVRSVIDNETIFTVQIPESSLR